MTAPPRARSVVAGLVRTATPKGDRSRYVRLDVNERPVAFPEHVTRAILSTLEADVLTAYPNVLVLYERLASHHGVAPEQLAITAGSEMAIRYLFEAYLAPGDGLVLLDPSFAMFEVYGRLCDARPTLVPFRSGCEMDADDILRAIQPGARIVAIANPNNPTGTVLDDEAMHAIVRRAGDVGALCLIDEAYFYFHEGTTVGWLPEFPHLVVCRTFSKAWGLAGIRLGYAIGAPEVIAELQKLQPIDHVNSLAVAAGLYMLDHEGIVLEYAADVRQARRSVADALRHMGCRVIESAANFLLVDAGRDPAAVAGWLKQADILVSTNLRLPFDHQYFRVSIGPQPVMTPFVDQMRRLMLEPA